MAATRIVCPTTAKPGAVIEIKTLIQHHMETGHRRDQVGNHLSSDLRWPHRAQADTRPLDLQCRHRPSQAAKGSRASSDLR